MTDAMIFRRAALSAARLMGAESGRRSPWPVDRTIATDVAEIHRNLQRAVGRPVPRWSKLMIEVIQEWRRAWSATTDGQRDKFTPDVCKAQAIRAQINYADAEDAYNRNANAWVDAIVREFGTGPAAENVIYSRIGRGAPGSALRAMFETMRDAEIDCLMANVSYLPKKVFRGMAA